jgi:hypothetical protein
VGGIRVKRIVVSGGSHPPKKRITVKKDMNMMFVYSAIKKNAKPILAYSRLYPLTSSASASGRSKGGRDVSASEEIKNIMKAGKRGSTNQTADCDVTKVVRFKVCAKVTAVSIIRAKEISYEIICAALRNAPRKAYFELDDHPARISPYTESEDIASTYNIPKFKSATTEFILNGIVAQFIKARAKNITGALTNKILFAFIGNSISFTNSFNPSAKGCSKPNGPTTEGPRRLCIAAITFLSRRVK